MTRTECAAIFVSDINERRIKFANKEISDMNRFQMIDFIIGFCEEYPVLMPDFISCKFNPIAFYYLCQWIIGEINEDQFGKVVAALNAKVETRHAPQHSNGAEPTEIISLCVSCVKENCFQRSEIKSCPVTICAMHQAK